jgi:hypothetical protein
VRHDPLGQVGDGPQHRHQRATQTWTPLPEGPEGNCPVRARAIVTSSWLHRVSRCFANVLGSRWPATCHAQKNVARTASEVVRPAGPPLSIVSHCR